jgi:arsenate reductase (thioredoxin)
MEKIYNVLFLSRRNSARSLMAELVLNRHGQGKFRAFSAGVEPSPNVDPIALDVLRQAGYATDGLQPKHWRKLSGRDGPILDFVFTLSDTAAGETLPEWRGRPATAHWQYPDPIKAEGDEWEKKRAFGLVLAGLERQLQIFVQLPFGSLEPMALKTRLGELGSARGA